MTYATRADLELRFGAPEVAELTADADRTVPALADAAAEIDAALAERYALPLATGTYPALVAIACDLARERLYDNAELEAVTMGARRARERLARLADGTDRLTDAAGGLVAARTRARATGNEPRLTRTALQDA